MTSRTAFHLDCTPILAECGCHCEACIDEMTSLFGQMPGVSKFYREGNGVVAEHDAGAVPVERLLDVFRGLPSFYRHRFVPSVMANTGGQG
jgi:hypothetical protein